MLPLDDSVRAQLAGVCARYGFARLEIFGSVARGEDTPASDVDVLYELVPGRHLGWEIEDAVDELAAILTRPVDLVSKRALHPLLRDEVEAQARVLYDAA
ncbi:MAG: nucleotidyltransferase domain-containing protein [Kineosporiaceae bacterium]